MSLSQRLLAIHLVCLSLIGGGADTLASILNLF